jgi:hypothetical protein
MITPGKLRAEIQKLTAGSRLLDTKLITFSSNLCPIKTKKKKKKNINRIFSVLVTGLIAVKFPVKVYFSRPKPYLILLYFYFIILNFFLNSQLLLHTHLIYTLLHFTSLYFTSLYLNTRNFTYNLSVPYRVADWHPVNIIKTLLPKIHN